MEEEKKDSEEEQTEEKASPEHQQLSNSSEKQEEEDLDELGEEELDLDCLEHYSTERLRTYCMEECLDVPSGEKEDYIKAILAYNEDLEPIPVEHGRDQEEMQDSFSDSGETEDSDELDLTLLESYSKATLRKYCEEERVAVNGRRKQDYIKAILEYNDTSDCEQSWLEVSKVAEEEQDDADNADDAETDENDQPPESIDRNDSVGPVFVPRRTSGVVAEVFQARVSNEQQADNSEESDRNQHSSCHVTSECRVSTNESGQEDLVQLWKQKALKWKTRAREMQRRLEATKSKQVKTPVGNKENVYC